ncbi:hypothetical protein SO802_006063 [Lithocarpus litseifolius]|uniref:CCHC-type domain-containing protein n=1 Tax=Lithocarpus litseifolius TaxID=425828 RepID=A0AAW2DNS3_9ROSI
MATDANQKLLPLAFAVVDKESGTSWGWFLECLRISIKHVSNAPLQSGLKVKTKAYSNFHTHFDDPSLKALVLKDGYTTYEAKFESIMQTIKDVEINALRSVKPDNPYIARYMPYTYLMILQGLHLDTTSYIDPCYSLDNAIQTYAHQFMVPKSESLWRDVHRPQWVPNPQLLRAKGRPVKSRIRNEMDRVRRERGSRREDLDLKEIQPRQRCRICHEEGHNRRRCPNSRGASRSGSATY